MRVRRDLVRREATNLLAQRAVLIGLEQITLPWSFHPKTGLFFGGRGRDGLWLEDGRRWG